MFPGLFLSTNHNSVNSMQLNATQLNSFMASLTSSYRYCQLKVIFHIDTAILSSCRQGPGRKPGASLYTRKRFSLSLSCRQGVHIIYFHSGRGARTSPFQVNLSCFLHCHHDFLATTQRIPRKVLKEMRHYTLCRGILSWTLSWACFGSKWRA